MLRTLKSDLVVTGKKYSWEDFLNSIMTSDVCQHVNDRSSNVLNNIRRRNKNRFNKVNLKS